MRANATLVEEKAKDEEGYQYTYYVPVMRKRERERGADPLPRKDYPDVIYRTLEVKLRAIAQEIVRFNVMGRPMLVGTTSVELSERLSGRLRREPVVGCCRCCLSAMPG